ncbi:MAG TPA: hypothetical protein VIE17_06825 [Methylophilaceae bacterium]
MHGLIIRSSIAIVAICFSGLASAGGPFDGDWYFKADAQGPRVSVFLQDTTFSGSAAELHLVQNGTAVTGTWRITGAANVQAGSLKGMVQGDTLQIYLCSDGAGEAGENGTTSCPNYPVEFDYLVNHGTWMAWYKNKQSGFEKYLALERSANDKHASQQEK